MTREEARNTILEALDQVDRQPPSPIVRALGEIQQAVKEDRLITIPWKDVTDASTVYDQLWSWCHERDEELQAVLRAALTLLRSGE